MLADFWLKNAAGQRLIGRENSFFKKLTEGLLKKVGVKGVGSSMSSALLSCTITQIMRSARGTVLSQHHQINQKIQLHLFPSENTVKFFEWFQLRANLN